MRRYGARHLGLAACLAALAGYVDAIGYLKLGGFFVSFMSGNSTRLAVGLAAAAPAARLAAGLIGAFLAGTIAGALVASAARRRRKPAVLLLVTLLLVAAFLDAAGGTRAAGFALAAAMGSENAVFQRDGEVSIALTYMTGTLVKLGQRIAGAMTGGDRWGWLPYLLLWCSLTGGAIAGATAAFHLGTLAIRIAVAWAAVLAAAAATLDPAERGTAAA